MQGARRPDGDGEVINKVPNKMLLVRLPPEVRNTA